MAEANVDVVVVGGGIVGLATALALLKARPSAKLVTLEKESSLGAHQTGHNSGVIHAGVYYKPGSLKASMCARGRVLLERFCQEQGVHHERCGKVILATDDQDLPRLDELERRGRANGLGGVKRIGPDELREREPHAAGVAALFVPETGIVDYSDVIRALAAEIARRGGQVRTSARVMRIKKQGDRLIAESSAGDIEARALVACAGLDSDRVARAAGLQTDLAIVPFRGEYWMLTPARAGLVKHLIYPVPDPTFPFLGVHFTRRVGGGIEAGPNAVLALKREGYTRASFDSRDTWDVLRWPGFWRMAGRHWRNGLREQIRSVSKRAFARACAKLVPELTVRDLEPAIAGVRAQALARDGTLVDDFAVIETERMVHTLNAPSPAATASLAIGEDLAARALRWL